MYSYSSFYQPKQPQSNDRPFIVRFEPDVNAIQMAKEFSRICNLSRGGTIDLAYLYFDPAAAAAWNEVAIKEDYVSSFEGGRSLDWVAKLIKSHLTDTKFNKNSIDIIGIACGDGKKEGKLIQALLDVDASLQVNCYLIDKSYPLLQLAQTHLHGLFSNTDRVQIIGWHADFWRLPYISGLFQTKEGKEHLRIACIFGHSFSNIDAEIRFVRDSLGSALKAGDLFFVDVMLGFAPHDKPDEILLEDPRLAPSSRMWMQETYNWLETVLRCGRKKPETVHFQNVLSTKSSSFPGSYTIEVHAHIENQEQPTRFNMLRLHRYEQESFIGTFVDEGFGRVGGKVFGANKRCLQYLFVKG